MKKDYFRPTPEVKKIIKGYKKAKYSTRNAYINALILKGKYYLDREEH